ncbi:MAG: GntR family transcriptional regulator [Marinilabiliaceae bacterium]|nr:GntR family transcriptional regulator [Marinilabiliaceae bacterium]
MAQKIVQVSSVSRQAKYRQIINSIIDSIANGKLKRGDKVPSINSISTEFGLSRDTVLLAFNELKARGIIVSSPGIGYFVESINVWNELKVFLLFDEFSSFKETIYNSFIESLDGKAQVDIYFHHFNIEVFESLIKDNVSRYTSFVILPGNLKNIKSILSVLPQDKVIILDQLSEETVGIYPAVYQDFENDTFNGLKSGLDKIKKYQRFVMVYPGGKEPLGFLTGFEKFCKQFEISYDVIQKINNTEIKPGDLYLLPSDRDLVFVINQAKGKKLSLGKDIGIISINDMPLKEVVSDGITTLSTDFEEMGKILAGLLLTNTSDSVKNPSKLIMRSSL